MPEQSRTKTSRHISVLAFCITVLICAVMAFITMYPVIRTSHTLERLDTLTTCRPHEALQQLQSLPDCPTRSQQSRKAWLQIKAMKKCGMTFTSDSLFKQALHAMDDRRIASQLHAGLADYYSSSRRYKEAADQYAQAYTLVHAADAADSSDTLANIAFEKMQRLMRIETNDSTVSEAQLRAEIDTRLHKAELEEMKHRSKESEDAMIWLFEGALALSLAYLLYSELHHRKHFRRLRGMLFSQADHMKAADTEVSTTREKLEEQRALLLQRERQLETSLNQLQQSQTQGEEQQMQILRMKDQLEQMREEAFLSNPVVQRIRRLSLLDEKQRAKAHKDYTLSADERKGLLDAVNLRYDHFADILYQTFPLLNADDLLVCVLLRMNVPNADVAFLLSCSEEALKKRKFRIKKEKLLQPSDGKPLDDFLHHFAAQDT